MKKRAALVVFVLVAGDESCGEGWVGFYAEGLGEFLAVHGQDDAIDAGRGGGRGLASARASARWGVVRVEIGGDTGAAAVCGDDNFAGRGMDGDLVNGDCGQVVVDLGPGCAAVEGGVGGELGAEIEEVGIGNVFTADACRSSGEVGAERFPGLAEIFG